jgi:hypothetical protein
MRELTQQIVVTSSRASGTCRRSRGVHGGEAKNGVCVGSHTGMSQCGRGNSGLCAVLTAQSLIPSVLFLKEERMGVGVCDYQSVYMRVLSFVESMISNLTPTQSAAKRRSTPLLSSFGLPIRSRACGTRRHLCSSHLSQDVFTL